VELARTRLAALAGHRRDRVCASRPGSGTGRPLLGAVADQRGDPCRRTVVLNGAPWTRSRPALDAAAPPELKALSDEIAGLGATPLAIRRNGTVLGVIELKDTVKPGLRARFDELRRMGIRTIMVTGDNH